MEIIPYGGWKRAARLVCGDTELVVTLDIGPRIMRYGVIGGPNELSEIPEDMGATGGTKYRFYGGHRLWIGPEDEQRTLQPDNDPVEHREENGALVLRTAPDRYGMQKEVRIAADAAAGRFVIDHAIENHSAYAVEFAPWSLSVMAAGGECLFPQAPFVPHPDRVLPARPLVLWSYTDMAEPRWTWGKRVIRLRQVAGKDPQKVGALVSQGYAAYANHGNVFLKRFPFIEGARYPDMGCNFETFTNADMLEVESLGPLQHVEPGARVEHREAWYLIKGAQPPAEDGACADWLEALAQARPL
ncbi:hypothetical protein [Sorangium atrum]|uniref:Uncharacterized protein n=1 Tax=Sorangium atrum TaxID=2995308 RepID=A0ABT5BVH4_9BACT|nr:hypothetical protein [Sorangium aterium]MDC0677688.1 hypothetical protein [Sorangium aterium]